MLCQNVIAQNLNYAKKIIDTLCSEYMHGRGYVNNGNRLAAEFIRNEFKNDNLISFDNNYFQAFKISIGTLPGKLKVQIGKNNLTPAVDFLVSASTATVKGKYKILQLDSQTVSDEVKFKIFINSNFQKKFILLNRQGVTNKKKLDLFNAIESGNVLKAKGVISVSNKMSWTVSDAGTIFPYVKMKLKDSKIPLGTKKIKVDIEQEFLKDYEINNVIGYIKGKINPDSFVVFTAHYDHLGQMGTSAYFPGANDNASGIAMMLDMADYYSENNPDYSVVFIAFTGEELGLLGSEYFAEHSLFPLAKIRFLINLDLVGTGDEGIKVVNGSVFEKEFNMLSHLNDEKKHLKSVNKRGEAAISDHFPFYSKGVKSFYIYTLGGISEYHNIYDRAETLPLTAYNGLFKLLVDFINEL